MRLRVLEKDLDRAKGDPLHHYHFEVFALTGKSILQ
jgi:hypothetical protein